MFSRQQARVTIQPTFFSPPLRAITTVDHMLIGVVQELDPSAQRAFISALAGVTRYAAAGDTEFRFHRSPAPAENSSRRGILARGSTPAAT